MKHKIKISGKFTNQLKSPPLFSIIHISAAIVSYKMGSYQGLFCA